MKGPKFHEMRDSELQAEARDLDSQLWKLRFQAATGQTEGLRRVRTMKRNVARIKTVLRERELLAQKQAQGAEGHG
jgi:large subunit ribosomal protein L29